MNAIDAGYFKEVFNAARDRMGGAVSPSDGLGG